MSIVRQVIAVTGMNLLSIGQRAGSSLVVVVGIAGVVGVLVSVLAMSEGLSGALLATGQDDRAIVLREGSTNEGGSSVGTEVLQAVMDAPGVAPGAGGEPLASGEMSASINIDRKADGARTGLVVRGVGPQGLELRPELKLVEGRWFKPGLREVVVGTGAQSEFAGLEIGDRITLREGEWTVVGSFVSGGTANESTLVTDADTLLSAYQRTLYNSVRVRLESPAAFTAFRDALTTNPAVSVNVMRETDFYRQATEGLSTLFLVITNVVGGIMALGALFAALNTMYSAVSTRGVEIATLRALGFGAGGVVCSVLVEALVLAVLGTVLGTAVAMLLFNGNTISIGGNGGSIVGQMRVTADVLRTAIGWALAVGLLGGLFPAIRAARLPVATALRAS